MALLAAGFGAVISLACGGTVKNVTPAALIMDDNKETYAILWEHHSIITVSDYKDDLQPLVVDCPKDSKERRLSEGANDFEVGLARREPLEVVQHSSNDCWAASAAGAVNFYGFVANEKLIHAPQRSGTPGPGTYAHIMNTLKQLIPGSSVRPSKFAIDSGAVRDIGGGYVYRDDADFVDDLLDGVPSIVVLEEPASEIAHSYLLGAARYSAGYKNKTAYREFELFDPRPGVGWKWVSADGLRARLVYSVKAKAIGLVGRFPPRCSLRGPPRGGEPVKIK
jgi:hypothetical protein